MKIENEEVEKLHAKFIKTKIKEKEPKIKYENSPFWKLFLIIILSFIAYVTLSIALLVIGSISMYQHFFDGDLINGMNSVWWGVVFIIVGFLMILPILRYFKNLFFILKNNYKNNKEFSV